METAFTDGSDASATPTAQKRKASAVEGSIETHPKKQYSNLGQRLEILEWYHAHGKNGALTARHFAPKYPSLRLTGGQVNHWAREEGKMKEEVAAGRGLDTKRKRWTENLEVDEMLELWVTKAMDDNVTITGEVLRSKWTRFADLAKVPADERVGLSNGWLEKFKRRVGLKEIRRHGEAASVSQDAALAEQLRVREVIRRYGFPRKDVYNMDETGLFWGCAPCWGIPGND